jgi:hypothetical protein
LLIRWQIDHRESKFRGGVDIVDAGREPSFLGGKIEAAHSLDCVSTVTLIDKPKRFPCSNPGRIGMKIVGLWGAARESTSADRGKIIPTGSPKSIGTVVLTQEREASPLSGRVRAWVTDDGFNAAASPGRSHEAPVSWSSTIDGRQIKSVIYSRMHGLDGELTWHRDYIRSYPASRAYQNGNFRANSGKSKIRG